VKELDTRFGSNPHLRLTLCIYMRCPWSQAVQFLTKQSFCSCKFVQQFLQSQCARVSYVTLQLVNVTMSPRITKFVDSLCKLPADAILYESELDNYLQLAMQIANLITGRRLQPQRGNASEARWTRSVRTANSEQRTANNE
jgi:hypothetical protein